MKTNYSDQIYLMNNSLLECAFVNDIDADTLRIYSSKNNVGTHYVVSVKTDPLTRMPVRCYFKKNFNK